jgi:hypothetical protein
MARDAPQERYQGLAVGKLLSRGAREEALLDAGAARPGLALSHDDETPTGEIAAPNVPVQ